MITVMALLLCIVWLCKHRGIPNEKQQGTIYIATYTQDNLAMRKTVSAVLTDCCKIIWYRKQLYTVNMIQKPIELLILFFIANPSICDDSAQHIQWSYGQMKLTKNEQGWFCKHFCSSDYKLQLNESSTNNSTIIREFLVDDIECSICRIPFNKGEY